MLQAVAMSTGCRNTHASMGISANFQVVHLEQSFSVLNLCTPGPIRSMHTGTATSAMTVHDTLTRHQQLTNSSKTIDTKSSELSMHHYQLCGPMNVRRLVASSIDQVKLARYGVQQANMSDACHHASCSNNNCS